MRIKFRFGKEQVPPVVVSEVLTALNDMCATDSMDIYIRFHNQDSKPVEICYKSEDGSLLEYCWVVSPQPLNPEPSGTIQHNSFNVGVGDQAHRFEVYWTIKD